MKNLRFLIVAFAFFMSTNLSAQQDQVYARVGNMPVFPGCEEYKSVFSREHCSDELMRDYIYENLKYPASAKNNKLTGKVKMQFVVRKDGSITDVKVIESLSKDCDAEAIRIVQSMNDMEQKWVAGGIRDKKVSVRLEVPIYFNEEDRDITFEDQSFDEDEMLEPEAIVDNGDEAPPVLVIEEEEEEEEEFDYTFTIVENMPTFPGCGDLESEHERKKCTERNLLKYMYQNIQYPTVARQNGIEGLIVAQFIIQPDGSVDQINILKGIGGGCDEETVRVVSSMNDMEEKWIPGRQRGRNVAVRYNLPIRFKLESDDTTEAEKPKQKQEKPKEEIFLTVDQMPVFPGCGKLSDEDEQRNCSDKNMKAYISNNLQYPLDALENDVEGSVVVQFVVTETGNVSNIKILKGLSTSCDVEAYRIINSMNSMSAGWIGGVHKSRKVKVQYTVPVYFNLSSMTDKQKRKLIKKLKKNN